MASSMRVEALRHREPINLSCVLPYRILIGFGAAIRGTPNLGIEIPEDNPNFTDELLSEGS